MRKVCASIFTIGLVVAAASPAFAQPRPGGRGGPGGGGFAPSAAMLLNEPKVQEELKVTDDQKAQFTKITDKYKEDMAKARADMNREKMGELRKAESEEMDKAIPTVLKPEQAKRLKQLEVQAGGLGGLGVNGATAVAQLELQPGLAGACGGTDFLNAHEKQGGDRLVRLQVRDENLHSPAFLPFLPFFAGWSAVGATSSIALVATAAVST